MSSRRKRSTKHRKTRVETVIVGKRAFREAFELLSEVMQAMGEEFEAFRADKDMPRETRRALMSLSAAHMKNASAVSYAFQASLYDPLDPDQSKLPTLN